MTDLSEYIGHILCEIARARVMADMEVLRIARGYVANEDQIMRQFSVPRMRLPSIEITVPILIDDVPDGYAERTQIDQTSLAKAISAELSPLLKEQKLQLRISDITESIASDPDLSRGRLTPATSENLLISFREKISKSTTRRKSKSEDNTSTPTERFNKIVELLQHRIRRALLTLPREPVGISIEPRTAAIREVGNPLLFVNAKLMISEEALEIQLEEEQVGGDSSTEDSVIPTEPASETPPRIKRLIPE